MDRRPIAAVPETSKKRREKQETHVSLRPWSDLPDLLLNGVIERLFSVFDIISFTFTCRRWYSISLSSLRNGTVNSLPPLLLRDQSDPIGRDSLSIRRRRRKHASHLLLISPADDSLRHRRSPASILPEPGSLLGYCHGFVIIFTPYKQLMVVNVFTGEKLYPPAPSFNPHYGFFTEPIDNSACQLLLFNYEGLRSWRLGDASWSELNSFGGKLVGIVHAVVFRGKLYAVDCNGYIFEIELTPQFIVKELLVDGVEALPLPELVTGKPFGRWLVDCCGELLMVWLSHDKEEPLASETIQVYRLVFKGQNLAWVKVQSLEDCCLFIDFHGRNTMACPRPGRWGGRSNCIYVAGQGCDSWIEIPLDGQPIEIQPSTSFSPVNILSTFFPPTWVVPNLLSFMKSLKLSESEC